MQAFDRTIRGERPTDRVVAAALPAIGPAAVSLRAEPAPASASARPFASREAYSSPFRTRDEWPAFVRGLPDGTAAAATYADLFSQADWDRCRDGTTTRAARITCRSDGPFTAAPARR